MDSAIAKDVEAEIATNRNADDGMGATEPTNVRVEIPVPDVACGPSVSMREASTGEKDDTGPNFNATSGPSSAVARTTPFVAINAIFNVPATLLRSTDVCASADACDVILTRESGKVATINDAAVAAVTPRTNDDWGRHGYIIAEIYKIIATMEPPWGRSVFLKRQLGGSRMWRQQHYG